MTEEMIAARIKSLQWILANIPDSGAGTFEGAIHLYINGAIEVMEHTISLIKTIDRSAES